MMPISWAHASILITTGTNLVLALLFLFFWLEARRPCFVWWTGSWTAGLAFHLLGVLEILQGAAVGAGLVGFVAALLQGVFLLCGIHALQTERPVSRYWALAVGGGILWMVLPEFSCRRHGTVSAPDPATSFSGTCKSGRPPDPRKAVGTRQPKKVLDRLVGIR